MIKLVKKIYKTQFCNFNIQIQLYKLVSLQVINNLFQKTMLKKTVALVRSPAQLIHRNTYKLLSSRHIEIEKKRFFEENQKTIKLKAKFFLKQMKYTLTQGTKDLRSDTAWLIDIMRNKRQDQLTGYQISKKRRVFLDLLKFIPYSVIIAVPAAQLCLPLILWLFPNAIPSIYLFDTTHDKATKKLQQKQKTAHQILLQQLLDTLKKLQKREDSFLQYEQFHKNFIQIADKLTAHLDYRKFTSDELMNVMDFMGGNYYTGTAIINKFVNLFSATIPRLTYKVYRHVYYKAILKLPEPPYEDPFFVNQDLAFLKLNYFPFQAIKRKYLLYQIQKKFKQMSQQDRAFMRNGMDDVIGVKIKDIARNRGLPTLSCYQSLKKVVMNDWVSATQFNIFQDNNVRLWYGVMLYSNLCENNSQQN